MIFATRGMPWPLTADDELYLPSSLEELRNFKRDGHKDTIIKIMKISEVPKVDMETAIKQVRSRF